MKSKIITRYIIVLSVGVTLFGGFQNCAPTKMNLAASLEQSSKSTSTDVDIDSSIVTTMPYDISQDEPALTAVVKTVANYEFYVDGLLANSSEQVGYEEAITSCHYSAVNHADQLVLCIYDGKEIFANVGQKMYRGFHSKNVFVSTRNLSYAEAVKNCLQSASENPTLETRCTWGDSEIYYQAIN